MQKSNVYEKFHILPLESKAMFRLKNVSCHRNEYILKHMANETDSCQPDMPITTEARLVLLKQKLTASERK